MKKFIIISHSLIFLFIFTSILNAQPVLNWNKIYDYNHNQDHPSQVVVDDSGNIYIVGQTEITNVPATNFDALILKYDPYGNLLWSKLTHLASWGGNDIYLKAMLTDEGNIFVSGNMQVDNSSKMYNVIYSPNGNVLWNDTKNYDTYWPYDCRNIFKGDSTYYVTDVYFASNSLKIVLLQFNNAGHFINVSDSQEFIGTPQNFAFSGSSFLLTYNLMNTAYPYQYKTVVREISLSGELEWETIVSDTMLSIAGVKSVYDKNKNIYTISNKMNDDSSAFYLTKLNHLGQILWDTTFVFEQNYYGDAADITISDSGIIKIVGTHSYWNGTTTEWGAFVALYDTNGNLIDFKRQIIPYTVQYYIDPKYDKYGNAYWVFGIQNTMGYLDILIRKMDESGELEQEFVYSHNNNQTYHEEPMDMYIVDEDNFVITARECGLVEAYNILTLRYGSTFTYVDNTYTETITSYKLDQNSPNPFNPTTKIRYTISNSSLVRLIIYNIIGEEITTLVNEEKNAGSYEQMFDASNLASGIYYYQLRTGNFVQTKKMVLIK